MKNLCSTLWLASLLLVTGCATAPAHDAAPMTPAGWETGIGRPGAVLYGRDGSPVGAAIPQNTTQAAMPPTVDPIVSSTTEMPHRPDETAGSRPVLLEMYQEVVSQKEGLESELQATQQALNATEDRMVDLEKRLEEEIRSRAAADQARLESENQAFEMGRRLAVAQMRRLEAEKLLLEKTLGERRKMAENAQ
ncbi:MAG: hypothetical protein H6830_09440 [Planctomycetes bacterium]|nr:hypothetical protein [Planctomycetota bacterium]MCB9909947.1 hypothetical protein [Planctomycetota bacterium]MCB9912916.1 hypothetical protein [Planctomycetota bacterium]HPF13119.1 hypothetical protein [Planctomycetota bacterium]HRV80073.1 hypothetical protein [Planctomycetota bacterium]